MGCIKSFLVMFDQNCFRIKSHKTLISFIERSFAGKGKQVTRNTCINFVFTLIKSYAFNQVHINMIAKVTDAMVSVEGEKMRGVTWVRVQEIESGQWAIGGQSLTADAVKAMAKG